MDGRLLHEHRGGLPVKHQPAGEGHRTAAQYVQHGVLFDEKRRQADQGAEHRNAEAQLPPVLEIRTPPYGEGGADGAYHVNGGKDVGIGVYPVEAPHHPRAQVVAAHESGTQILSVGKEEPDELAEKKGNGKEAHVPPESVLIPAQQIDPHPDQQGVPGAVGEDEKAAEGDQIVYGELGGPVGGDDQMLRCEIGQQIKGEPQRPAQQGQLVRSQLPVQSFRILSRR